MTRRKDGDITEEEKMAETCLEAQTLYQKLKASRSDHAARILALINECDFQERCSNAFEDELERVHDQLWSTLKVLGIAAKPTPHHDLEHCTEQIKSTVVALIDENRVLRERVAELEKENEDLYRAMWIVTGSLKQQGERLTFEKYKISLRQCMDQIAALTSSEQEPK